MVGEGEKKEQKQVPVGKYVERFADAIKGIKASDSKTFDLMAEKAVEFYLSNKNNKDLTGQIINATQALFYFLAFAIAHPRLTHKLRLSLQDLNDPKRPDLAKEFAIEVMKSKDVWDQLINNENLRPHIIRLGQHLISVAGLPFPSYEEMEMEYIKAQKNAGNPKPVYTNDLYILGDLMNTKMEGFEDAPKTGTPEYDAKLKYISGVLESRAAYAKLLGNEKVLSATLSAAQALVTDEKINAAVVGYLTAPEGEAEIGPVIEAVLLDNKGLNAIEPLIEIIPDVADKIPALKDYAEVLGDKEILSTALSTAQTLMADESINSAVVSYVTAPEGEPELGPIPSKALPVIEAVLFKPEGFEAIKPLVDKLPDIVEKTPALKEAIPDFIDFNEMHEELLDGKNGEITFITATELFKKYNKIEAIYVGYQISPEEGNIAVIELIKAQGLGAIWLVLTEHPTLIPYVSKVVNAYLDKEANLTFGERKTLYDKPYTREIYERENEVTKKNLEQISKFPEEFGAQIDYDTKFLSKSFEERKAEYDSFSKEGREDYTEDMYKEEQKAAKDTAASVKGYITILNEFKKDPRPIDEVIKVLEDVMADKAVSQAIVEYLQNPVPAGEVIPSAFMPIITSLLDKDKLDQLIGKLEFIFRTLSPNNFTPGAPEFGEGMMDKSLLNLIFEMVDPNKKVETYNFLKVAVGEVNNILKEFKAKPLFVAIHGVVGIIANNSVLKGFVESNSSLIGKLVRYIVLKNFGKYCTQYGIVDKFWGVLDIALKDLGAVSDLLIGLQEIAKRSNYKNEDGSFNGKGTEKAVDTFVRALVNTLNHPVIGAELRQFIKDNKEVFVSLLDGIFNNIPAVKPYITQYVLGLGLTFSGVLDQLVHNPNDLIKLLDIAKDIGALRGEISPDNIAGAVENAWQKGEGLGLYSPVVQQVIAKVTAPYIPKVVTDWTPQWFKNYVPGGTAAGDRRGANFGDWVFKNINRTPQAPNTSLHDTLVARAKDNKDVTDEAREFINYNALAKLNFGEEDFMLSRYLIEGFSFERSKVMEVYMTDSTIKQSNFKGFEAKECFINHSEMDRVKFDGSKLDKVVIKKEAVLNNVSFKDVRAREFTITDATLTSIDFTGLKFEKDVPGWLYGSSVVASTDAVLTIKNSSIDEASLKNLRAAAKAGSFKVELDNVEITKDPSLEAKRCAKRIVSHLKTVEFIEEGLDAVQHDPELKEFLEEVMRHAFSHMQQDNLMYFPHLNMHGLYSVLQSEDIVRSLESVYEMEDDEVYIDEQCKVEFAQEVQKAVEDFCTKERIEKKDKIEPRDKRQQAERGL